MSRVLIIAEHDNRTLNASTGKCVSCATYLEPESIHIMVLGHGCASVAQQASQLLGIAKVLLLDDQVNRAPLAAIFAPQVAALAADGYTHVLGPSTTFGKDLMPRVAALLGVGQLSDIMAIESPYRYVRPTYAGNAITTVEAPQNRILVATVRTASYPDCAQGDAAPVETPTVDAVLPTHTRFVELKSASSDRPDLQTANRVVSGGRALGSAENFRLIFELADKLGAAVGASRAAVDSGFVPNDMQVGQTGKIIAPELYVAVGISGAIQHLTGIKDAATIVAINKDSDAPIFDIADIGLVADLFEAVPALIKALDDAPT
jgi:electron transfer flavoprotein alpha subunit